MFDDETLGAQILTNPGIMQNMILTEQNDRLNGVYSFADPNNCLNFMFEAGSSMLAQSCRYMESQFETLYAARAVTSQQLYKQMSDYDYLQIVSNPALTNVRMIFNIDYLTANALPFNSNYSKVVIPAESIFNIGALQYGMYYPIEIRINANTNSVVVVYDDSVPNPLFPLTSNVVEYAIQPFEGLNILTITFPIYQFSAQYTEANVTRQTGYQGSFTYTDSFYAARIFTNVNGNNSAGQPIWTELAYTLSEVYDVTVPTAQLLLLEDESTIIVTVPQIYFTNNQIGNKLKIILYTTQGDVNITLTAAEVASCTASFNLTLDTITQWSSILAKLPTIALFPSDIEIAGGSNGLTFQQLRTNIVNGSLYDGVPITPQDRVNFLVKNGFTLTRYKDNVTDRIYYAGITMIGGSNGTIPVTVANIKIDTTAIEQTSSIKSFSDGSIMVFPTTLYQYVPLNSTCVPLTDAQLASLAGLTKDNLAVTLNDTTYTQYPFHYVTYTDNPYPVTKSFNLMNPAADNIRFIEENPSSIAQMTMVNANVIHQNNGTGGYIVQLAVTKTAGVQALPESEITVLLATTDTAGVPVFFVATWVSVAPVGASYTDVYNVAIPTAYQITIDGTFPTQANTNATTTINCNLPLVTEFDVKFFVAQAAFPTVLQDFNITSNVDGSYIVNNLAIAYQTMRVTFGVDLSNGIFNITDAVYGAQTFMTWPANIYETYLTDVYKTNPDGTLLLDIVNGAVVSYKIHSAGDQVLDSNGHPTVKYPAGSNKLDVNGDPIPLGTRNIVYYVQTMQFDTRLFESQNPADVAYTSKLAGVINSYVDTVNTLEQTLLEETNLYFLPASTIGTASYTTGNGQTESLPLGISFGFDIYIYNYDATNPIYQNLKALIETKASTIIAQAIIQPIISSVAIANSIQQAFSTDISSVDTLGMNGNINLQTLQVNGNLVAPNIALILVHNIDDTMTLNQNIALNFYPTVQIPQSGNG